MSRRPIRVGIAGANSARGWARDAHVPALQRLPEFEIHAVSARTDAIANEAAAAFGARTAYGDTLAMVRDPEVDLIAVTVKVPEHRAIVMAAIEAGKHIYCEWPLGRDAAETAEMAEAVRTAAIHVAVGLQGANAAAVRKAAQLVAAGAIGRPLNLRVISPTAGWGPVAPLFYAYLQDKANGATLATIAGGHTLAMIEAVVGPCLSVGSRNSILRDRVAILGTDEVVIRTCPDHMLIHAIHESGCISGIEIVGGQDMPLQFELRGSEGSLVLHAHHPGGYQCAPLSLSVDGKTLEIDNPVTEDLPDAAINVAQLYWRLGDDIVANRRTVPDFEVALRLTRLLDAIDAASSEGRTLSVN